MEVLWFTVVFIVVLLTSFRVMRKDRTVALINKIPGPKALPIVGNFFDEFSHRTDIMWKIMERNKKYSPIYRVWHGPLPVVYISSAEIANTRQRDKTGGDSHQYQLAVWEKILGCGSARHLSKGFFYRFLLPWLGDGLLTSDGPKWFTHRKLLTPAFHHRILSTYLNAFDENSRILAAKLEERADNGEIFDVYPLVSLCTLDIICEAAMGIKINAQSQHCPPYANAVYRVLQLTKERFINFWMFPDIVYYATKSGREYRELVRRLHEFTNGIISERKRVLNARKESILPVEDVEIGVKRKIRPFLDLLLREAQTAHLTDEDIRQEVDTFAFEGHETTAVAVCWALFLLGLNGEIQEKAYEEQISIFGVDERRPTRMKDLNDMKYLERIIKETSRIYPSIPLIARIPDEDIKCDDYTIPKGTTVILNIYNLHRNAEVFPDPEKFDPDRFHMERPPRHPYSHLPFSAGSRNCIGQKFALLEEKVILSSIIRKYRVASMDTRSDIKLVNDLLLKSGSGIRLRVFKRSGRAENSSSRAT